MMSDAMDSDVREVIRRRIAIRERDGHERLLLNHEALRALLDAADELDRLLTVAPCSEEHTAPFDFAYCSTHDRTFALGDHCDYAGLSEVGYLEKQARGQRVRAIRAEDERDRLRVTVQRVRQACHEFAQVESFDDDYDRGYTVGYNDALDAILSLAAADHE